MSEYDSLIEGYPGLDDPANDPGPLSPAESKKLAEVFETEEPPHEPDDWPEEEEQVVLEGAAIAGIPIISDESIPDEVVILTDLRPLKPDQRPERGKHFVVFNGKPMPVVRDNFGATEDEFVRSQLDLSDTLKDHDGQRQVRADRTLRMRYRGYVCGEMSSL